VRTQFHSERRGGGGEGSGYDKEGSTTTFTLRTSMPKKGGKLGDGAGISQGMKNGEKKYTSGELERARELVLQSGERHREGGEVLPGP